MRFRTTTLIALLGLFFIFHFPPAHADSALEVTEQGATEASKELPTCKALKDEITLQVSEFEMATTPTAKQRYPNTRCDNAAIKEGARCDDVGFVCLKHDRLRPGCLLTWEYQYCTCIEMTGAQKYECHYGKQK